MVLFFILRFSRGYTCWVEQDVTSEVALAHPVLYRDGAEEAFLSPKIFWRCAVVVRMCLCSSRVRVLGLQPFFLPVDIQHNDSVRDGSSILERCKLFRHKTTRQIYYIVMQ